MKSNLPITCCDECLPVCDFCIYYNFNGNEFGGYIEKGWCRKHKEERDPGSQCENFHCFRAADKKFEKELELHKKNNILEETELNNWKVEMLQKGESIIVKESGNSMTPLIKSKQPVRLVPIKMEDVKVGDIVYCKVKGKFYLHIVKAKNEERGCLIGNNRGKTNGWTKQIYGKATEKLVDVLNP